MVVSPESKTMFPVDVKGLYRKNPWVIKRKDPRENTYYILAFVPPDAPNRFFVLKQDAANALIASELRRLGRPDDYPMTGIRFEQAAP